jgi:hypothetical protein
MKDIYHSGMHRKTLMGCLGMRNSVITVMLLLLSAGCGNKDEKRIAALNAMPVLYESTILTAVIQNPAPDAFFTMDDSVDPNLMQSMQGDYHTENYIPESVLAITPGRAKIDTLKRSATIKVGDRVSVLAKGDNGNKKAVYLVRTAQFTYCWVYAFHLQDKDGNRLEEMKPE